MFWGGWVWVWWVFFPLEHSSIREGWEKPPTIWKAVVCYLKRQLLVPELSPLHVVMDHTSVPTFSCLQQVKKNVCFILPKL